MNTKRLMTNKAKINEIVRKYDLQPAKRFSDKLKNGYKLKWWYCFGDLYRVREAFSEIRKYVGKGDVYLWDNRSLVIIIK